MILMILQIKTESKKKMKNMMYKNYFLFIKKSLWIYQTHHCFHKYIIINGNNNTSI